MESSRKQAAIFLWKASGKEKGHALQSIFATMRHLRTMTGTKRRTATASSVMSQAAGRFCWSKMKTLSACSARALRSKEYKVVEARNGEAALQILGNARFDLLINNMVMSKVGRAEVIKAARAEDPNIPVVCISGYTLETVA